MVDEYLLALARNVRAGLLHAVDYDDEVATLYVALQLAQRMRPLPTLRYDYTMRDAEWR